MGDIEMNYNVGGGGHGADCLPSFPGFYSLCFNDFADGQSFAVDWFTTLKNRSQRLKNTESVDNVPPI